MSENLGIKDVAEQHLNNIENSCNVNKQKIDDMSKFKTIEKYDKPTDVVILGSYDDYGTEFQITDDETSFDIYQDGKRKFSLSSMGFGSIMSLSDYKKLYKEKGEEMGEWGIIEGVVIPNFTGNIGIAALDDKGVYHDDVDISDYIQHQFGGYCDVVINIPSGLRIIKLNDDLSLPTAVVRDITIDKVLDKSVIKKFSDFNQEDIDEAKEDFLENYGYEMGDDFLFAIVEDNDPYRDPDYAPFILAIQPKSYWDNEQCQYDQHVGIDCGGVLDLPKEFEEMQESSFSYLGSDPIECISKLVNLGIKFDCDFNDFMENHVGTNLHINGLLVKDYMKQNHPNSIV